MGAPQWAELLAEERRSPDPQQGQNEMCWGWFAQVGDRTVTVGQNCGSHEHREADSQMPCTETFIGNALGKLESLRSLQNVRAAGSISHEERRRRLTCLAGRQLTNIVRDEQQLAEVQAEALATEDL